MFKKNYYIETSDNMVKNVFYWFLVSNKYTFVCNKCDDIFTFDMKLTKKQYQKFMTLVNYLEC